MSIFILIFRIIFLVNVICQVEKIDRRFLSSKILTDFIPQSISFPPLALLPGWLRFHSISQKSRATLNDG